MNISRESGSDLRDPWSSFSETYTKTTRRSVSKSIENELNFMIDMQFYVY